MLVTSQNTAKDVVKFVISSTIFVFVYSNFKKCSRVNTFVTLLVQQQKAISSLLPLTNLDFPYTQMIKSIEMNKAYT